MTKERLCELGVSEEIAEAVARELGQMVPKSRLDEVIAARNAAVEALEHEKRVGATRAEFEQALRAAGVRSVKLALPLMDLNADPNAQIEALKADPETCLLFEHEGIRGVTPGESADRSFGIDRETFLQHKDDPNWINRNWAQVSDALAQGRIHE